jgi:hypothetical protein
MIKDMGLIIWYEKIEYNYRKRNRCVCSIFW